MPQAIRTRAQMALKHESLYGSAVQRFMQEVYCYRSWVIADADKITRRAASWMPGLSRR